MTMWRMRIPCWIPKATNTHSVNVIINDFQLQKWLQERVNEQRVLCSHMFMSDLEQQINTIHSIQ